jgi:hypothetical protein
MKTIEEKKPRNILYTTLVALTFSCFFGGLTLAIETLATISDKEIVGTAQHCLLILIVPGMVASMALSGNVHAFSLWTAAVANALIYFGVGWFISRLYIRVVKRNTPSRI